MYTCIGHASNIHIPWLLYNCIHHVYIYVFVYSLLTWMLITIQATTSELRSQITTLQAALKGEIAARKEHEAKLTSQFQVCLCRKQGVSHLNV